MAGRLVDVLKNTVICNNFNAWNIFFQKILYSTPLRPAVNVRCANLDERVLMGGSDLGAIIFHYDQTLYPTALLNCLS